MPPTPDSMRSTTITRSIEWRHAAVHDMVRCKWPRRRAESGTRKGPVCRRVDTDPAQQFRDRSLPEIPLLAFSINTCFCISAFQRLANSIMDLVDFFQVIARDHQAMILHDEYRRFVIPFPDVFFKKTFHIQK